MEKKLLNKFIFIFNKIFCHHSEIDRDSCFKVKLKSHYLYLCSRCFGLYSFTVVLLFILLKWNPNFIKYTKDYLLYFLFIPFFDWSLNLLKIIKTHKLIKFFTGIIGSFGLSQFCYFFLSNTYIDIVIKTFAYYSIGIIIVLIIFINLNTIKVYVKNDEKNFN